LTARPETALLQDPRRRAPFFSSVGTHDADLGAAQRETNEFRGASVAYPLF